MKISKAHIMVKHDDGVHYHVIMDVIEHEGEFWLVPEWLDNQSLKATMPLRIVSLATMAFHQTPGTGLHPVPKTPSLVF